MTRVPLPNRRPSMTANTVHGGQALTVTLGFGPDGRVGEVFAGAEKAGSGIDASLSDAMIGASIALQHGVGLASLTKSLGMVPEPGIGADGQPLEQMVPASPVGAVLALAAEADADPVAFLRGPA